MTQAAIGVVVVGVCTAGVLLEQEGPTPGPVWMTATLAASFTPLATFILRRQPGHRVGRLMWWIGTTATLATLAVCWSTLLPLAWLSQWLWWPPIVLIPVLLLIFPDGRLPSRRWRPLTWTLVLIGALATVSLAVAATTAPRTLLTTIEPPASRLGQVLVRIALLWVLVFGIAAVAVAASLIVRWRRADVLERHQLACLLPSAVLFLVGFSLDYFDVPGGWLAAVVALPVGVTFAILQYQLYDLDLYIHRGLVWLVLTGLAVAAYAVTVAAVQTLIAPSRWVLALIGGAVAAASLIPAERLAQRAVRRLLYGSQDDPYLVLTRVGRHMEAISDPLAVLPRFAATLAQEMRVPYVAIMLEAGSEDPLLVEHGRPTVEPARFVMTAHGIDVGVLLIGYRRPGARFGRAETRLLLGLARQAAVAAEACRSTLELERARERLVLAREEERRRLRRDLHDGVGSGLVGARMLTVAARQAVPQDGGAPRLLETLATHLETCIREMRDLIDGLRPAALDKGLAPALRELAARVDAATLTVDVRVEGSLGELPAAVEVVAYRVVTEALTNVVKHARAQHCLVQLIHRENRLLVAVNDDGIGLQKTGPAGPDSGVGLTSIRSRVAEVGGRVDIDSSPAGTSIRAWILIHPTRPTVEPGQEVPGQPPPGAT